ncbi:indole-3-glycerol phosphate synthase TrpC [Deltaproteobacteria bacterium PRO3]|nr:indole-3-glycerol phosphate synthase TrpC [Deltaproteobacteria bacterium PRO3]
MILEKIYKYKLEELEHYKRQLRPEDAKERAKDAAYRPLSLAKALREAPGAFAVIAEIKRQSPSKGVLRADFDPVGIARGYEEAGAAALSVLTDEHFFGGHLEHLRQVRQAVKLPLLRKDFLWDPYQIYVAREAGADAILLIAAMLGRWQMEDLQGLAEELGLSVLVEVHDAAEAERAAGIGAKIVGINNRDLKTFKVDVGLTEALLPKLPAAAVKVSESGLDSAEVLKRLKAAGADAFLIGEAFMKAPHPGEALKGFLK